MGQRSVFFPCFLFDLCLAVHTIGYMVSMWRLYMYWFYYDVSKLSTNKEKEKKKFQFTNVLSFIFNGNSSI